MARSPRGPEVPPTPPSLRSSLILRFHTFKPGGHRTRGGGHPSAAAGFNFLPRCQPQTCPGTCPRSAPQARAASPAFLSAAPAGTAPGASAGASTPRPSVPDDAGGGQRSGPAPAEDADAAGRGCMPGQSCTSPLADHKRLGKRAGKGRPSYCSYLRPPGPCPHTRAAAFGPRVSLRHPRAVWPLQVYDARCPVDAPGSPGVGDSTEERRLQPAGKRAQEGEGRTGRCQEKETTGLEP